MSPRRPAPTAPRTTGSSQQGPRTRDRLRRAAARWERIVRGAPWVGKTTSASASISVTRTSSACEWVRGAWILASSIILVRWLGMARRSITALASRSPCPVSLLGGCAYLALPAVRRRSSSRRPSATPTRRRRRTTEAEADTRRRRGAARTQHESKQHAQRAFATRRLRNTTAADTARGMSVQSRLPHRWFGATIIQR